jgi:kynureninase
VSADDRNDPLLKFRPEFPILERTTYLVSNSLGAMPRTVADRLAEYVDDWAQLGVRAWTKGWWEMPLKVGDEIAPLIGARDGEVVMIPNVTMAQATVLSSLEYTAPRNRIVMTALDFPSVRYVYDALATRLGAEVVVVPASADGLGVDLEELLAHIDERTMLVSISHVLFRSAYVMDVKTICQRAHEVGALVSLDAFHSVGIVPVDVEDIGCDFLTGGVLKWLCGGPGGCFLYVKSGLRQTLEPALTGWQAHARPFAFEGDMDYSSDAFRWLGGTPVIPALYAAAEGPKIVRRAGIEAIREKSLRQTQKIIELASAQGLEVRTPREAARRGGTVTIATPDAYEVSRWLVHDNYLVDYRPDAGIRIAPHFYTEDRELEGVFNGIQAAIGMIQLGHMAPDRHAVVT